MSEIKLITWIR